MKRSQYLINSALDKVDTLLILGLLCSLHPQTSAGGNNCRTITHVVDFLMMVKSEFTMLTRTQCSKTADEDSENSDHELKKSIAYIVR